MTTPVVVLFSDLVLDPMINARDCGIVPEVVEEYSESRRSGVEFPPGRAFRDADGLIRLSRGFHRAEAYKQAGDAGFPVELLDGDRNAAILDALGDNIAHGLKRTNADKRLCVERCLGLCPNWTQRQVAEQCGVSQQYVSKVAAELDAISSFEETPTDVTQTSQFTTVVNTEVPTPGEGNHHVGRKRTKADAAARVVEALKQDLDRADEDIAAATKTKHEFVSEIRKALHKQGYISAGVNTKPAQEEPPDVTDAWGIPVQPHAEEAFAALPKFKELLAAIQHAQRLFNEVASLPGGKFLTLSDVSSYRRSKKSDDGEHAGRFVHEGLEQAYHHVKAAAPAHTVCPFRYVDAPHPDDCRTCRGLNWTPALSPTAIPPCAAARAKEAHGV